MKEKNVLQSDKQAAWGKIEQREIEVPPTKPVMSADGVWLSETPPDCPFAQSEALKGVQFTGRHAEYANADTWYPSWAADGNLYSPFTDGAVNGVESVSCAPLYSTGYATIRGDDPPKLEVTDVGRHRSEAFPYAGRYPCGTLVHNGVWYYGTYALGPGGASPQRDGETYIWPWVGPLVGFHYSTDFGKTWTQSPCTPEKSLFGENGRRGEPVKIGKAHFVDFGKNMEHSPDGKAYLVSHGASDGVKRRVGYNSWVSGDEIYLLRVTPTIENINDPSKYEFFAGYDGSGAAVWSHDFSKIKPIAEWRDNMGCVTMTYVAPLKKYIMCVTEGLKPRQYYNSYLLESSFMTGPWKRASYLQNFGPYAWFVNIPSKFISADGRSMWLCYSSGNGLGKNRPLGARYGLSLQEMKLLSPSSTIPSFPPSPLDAENNIARKAVVTVSSIAQGTVPGGAVDGKVGGSPDNIDQEWVSREKDTAMLRLNWSQPQTIDRVWLFDRPNGTDRITSAMLVFSDGMTIPLGPLPEGAKKGLEVKFEPKTVTWLALIITGVGPETQMVGLSEIGVFHVGKPKP